MSLAFFIAGMFVFSVAMAFGFTRDNFEGDFGKSKIWIVIAFVVESIVLCLFSFMLS